MDMMVRDFAMQMLRKLQRRNSESRAPHVPQGDVKMNGDDEGEGEHEENGSAEPSEKPSREAGPDMEDGQLPLEDLVQTPYLPDQLELPAKKSEVLQHVELVFALSVKDPQFLDA